MKISNLFRLLPLLAAAPCLAGTVTYMVSIDTTSLVKGTSGIIDLAFNGGFPATATVDGFTDTGGSLDATSITTAPSADIVGTLPGDVTLDQNNTFYDENLVFGSSINFNLIFSGTPGGSMGDTFTLTFFTPGFGDSLLSGDASSGELAQFQLDTTGGVTATAALNPAGGPSFATLAVVTPEPSTSFLFIAGLLGTFLALRRYAPLCTRS